MSSLAPNLGPTDHVSPPNHTELDELLREAELAHGHLCAGQILGVRMAMLACRILGIHAPRLKSSPDRKRLVTFVEIDRCATDAIGVVTGCRIGKRALKVEDWGKMAATFLDLDRPLPQTAAAPDPHLYQALRIVALESAKELARSAFPDILDKNHQQMRAYRELPDYDLFRAAWVSVPLPPSERPGYKGARATCSLCGEGINFDRYTTAPSGQVLCLSCTAPANRYYRPLPGLPGPDF